MVIRNAIDSFLTKLERRFGETNLDHRHTLFLGLSFLLLMYIGVFLVDIKNIFGLRALFHGRTVPALWDLLFTEAGPVELVQWFFLGGLTVISGLISGRLRERGEHRKSRFWLFFSIAGFLFLMEDAGNVRHFFLRNLFALDWTVLNVLETLYFGLLAFFPVYAVVRFGKDIVGKNITTKLLIIGFIFYGSAAVLSGPLEATEYDWRLGDGIYNIMVGVGGEELRELYEDADQRILELERERGVTMMDVRTRLVDYPVEESLELMGVVFLVSSALSYKKEVF